MSKNINPIVKAQLDEFKKGAPEGYKSDSDLFEVMSIYAVENGILGEDVNPFRAHLKGCEFGVDGIAVMIQGSLCVDKDEAISVLDAITKHDASFHFFQSKTSDSIDYGDVSKFLDGVYDFFKDMDLLKGVQVEDLRDAKDEVLSRSTKSNPNIKCYYCTTGSGEIAAAIKTLIDQEKAKLEGLSIFGSVSIECLGAKEIQQGFRAANNAITATINFPKAVTMPEHPKVDEAYIGYVSSDQILNMALGEEESNGKKYINRAVFYDNIRDFDPSSEINKKIIEEAKEGDPSSFVYKNNGVTVVARSINRRGDMFTLEDFQIVNGCQTTNILFEIGENLSDIMVPLRIVASSDSDFVSKIIIGTNKQNAVREDQFWALRPFMKDLETYCEAREGEDKILVERRDNQYRSMTVERSRVIKPSDLMKVAAAMFFYQPHRAARDYRGILNEFSDKIFKDEHNVEMYHAAAMALYKFDYMIRNSKADRSRSIYKFYILFSLMRKRWKTPDILDANKKSQRRIYNSLIEEIHDNDAMLDHIESVSSHVDGLLANSAVTSREKIRDYIRLESFYYEFERSYFTD